MQVKNGDKVKVHYALKLEDNREIESSKNSLPMEFTIGKGQMIKGFEDEVIGMKVGETKTVKVSEKEAYGPRQDKKVFEFPKEKVPPGFDPVIGQIVQLNAPDGTAFPVTVVAATENGYTMDANHPLAGNDLMFDIELMEIVT